MWMSPTLRATTRDEPHVTCTAHAHAQYAHVHVPPWDMSPLCLIWEGRGREEGRDMSSTRCEPSETRSLVAVAVVAAAAAAVAVAVAVA